MIREIEEICVKQMQKLSLRTTGSDLLRQGLTLYIEHCSRARLKIELHVVDAWQTILALGDFVDKDFNEQDVRLTMGGEPTFVSIDDMDGAQWNTEALGEDKLKLAKQLLLRLRDRFAPNEAKRKASTKNPRTQQSLYC